MKSLSWKNQAGIIEAFNSTSRYLDDLLTIYNIYFEHMVDPIYPAERQLNKDNSSNTEAPLFFFLFLYIYIYIYFLFIWIYQYLMVRFQLEFMINGTTLILI